MTVRSYRRVTRSGFAERIGLFGADLTPRQGSAVADCVTRFYDGNGICLGTFTRSKCAITGRFEDQFNVLAATDEPDEAHSSLWL